MLLSRSAFLVSLSSLLALAVAQSSNPFTSPTAGDTVTVGETTEITWTADSSIDEVGLSMCRGSGQDCGPIATVSNTGSYDWTPDSDLPSDSTYYLILTGPSGFIGNSGVFEIEGSDDTTTSSTSSSSSSPTTTSGPSSSTAGSSTTRGASTTTGSSSPSSSSTGTPQESEGTPVGAIVGGAVAAIIVVVVLAVGGLFWMRKRNKEKLAAARAGRSSSDDDDVEAGKKMKRDSMIGVAGKSGKKPIEEAYKPKDEPNGFQLAELPAVQQEPVEMETVSGTNGGNQNHFFAMELDSREIPRPGTSTVKPDIDTTTGPKPSMDKGETRGVSIDGTTVNSESERPKTAGTIDQIKEESREGPSREQAQTTSPVAAPTPTQTEEPRTPATQAPLNTHASRVRDSTPQLRNSIPSLPAFDFDSSKF